MVNEANIILAILLSCFAMFTMVMVIIVFVVLQKRKMSERDNLHQLELKNKELELLRSHIETQEFERERTARNIHDDIGPLVTALKLHLFGFKIKLEKGELMQEHLDEELKFATLIFESLRTTTKDLSPYFLLRNGLFEAFEYYFYELPDIKCTFETEVTVDIELPMDVKVNCYRVLLEVVNNILKHDTPTRFDVHMEMNMEHIRFSIVHDGKGMTNEDFMRFSENSEGIGMSSLKSRTTLLSAELDFQIGENPMVIFTVPLPHGADD